MNEAAKVLNSISDTPNFSSDDIHIYAPSLQQLYIRYVRMMTKEKYILSPRSFFIYLTTRKLPWNELLLVARIREMVDMCDKLDLKPTETMGGKHILALSIFISS
jgi:hypothetical protein